VVPVHAVAVTPALLVAVAFTLPLLSLKIRRTSLFHGIALATTSTVLALTLYSYTYVSSSGRPLVYRMGGWPPPLGIVYEVDSFSALLAMYTALVLVAVVAYSSWYLGEDGGLPYYYALLLGLEAGLLGIYYTGDVFNLFVMIEVLGITCYGLVAYYRNTREAVEASFKYAFFGAIAGLLYFLAAVLIYASFGNLTMGFVATFSRPVYRLTYGNIASMLIWGNITAAVGAVLALSLWTFTFEAGVFPNHFWLPDAHPAAPTPISAVLSGLVVNAGAYAAIRFLYTIFGVFDPLSEFYELSKYVKVVLLAVGAISAVFASVMMVVQADVKRLIAYSTIMHLGLVFTGFSLGTLEGVRASVYHMLTHAAGKALLFMSAGVAIEVSGTRRIVELKAVGRVYKLVGLSTLLSCLSLVGLPPLAGFFSKLALYQAYVQSGHFELIAVLLVSSAIALLGYLKVLYPTVFGQPPVGNEVARLRGLGLAVALAIPVVLIVLLNPPVIGETLEQASRAVTDPGKYIDEALSTFINYLSRLYLTSGG
jgi:multicomponent Na+:H+ antiporter subunit D